MQGVEHDVRAAAGGRPQELDQGAQVALHVVFDDLVPALAQSFGAGLAAHERDLALGRPAAHQDRDALHACLIPAGLADAPDFPFELHAGLFAARGGALPRPAPRCRSPWRSPRLIRKLQCFSETCASPMRRPRHPASSISSQARRPGGLTKVEPPVRLRGWDSVRAVSISAMRRAMASWSPGVPRKRAEVKIQSAGASLWR